MTTQLVMQLQLSYFADGAHHVHDLYGCTYYGCDAFLPEARCRAAVKFPERGR